MTATDAEKPRHINSFLFLGPFFSHLVGLLVDQLGVCVAHVLMKTVGGSWPSAVQEAVA